MVRKKMKMMRKASWLYERVFQLVTLPISLYAYVYV